MAKKLFCMLIFFYYIQSIAVESQGYKYKILEDIIKDYLIKGRDAIELNGIKREKLLNFSQKINDYIEKEDIDNLLKNMTIDSFIFFDAKDEKWNSENISKIIRKELLERKGFYYYFLFNAEELYKGINDKLANPTAKGVDIRKHLLENKNKLKWYIFYLPKEDAYEAWFSIPDDYIEDLGYFHYRIKEIGGKLILIGF